MYVRMYVNEPGDLAMWLNAAYDVNLCSSDAFAEVCGVTFRKH